MELGRNQFQFPRPAAASVSSLSEEESEEEKERERKGGGEAKKKSGSVRSLNTFRLGVSACLYPCLCTTPSLFIGIFCTGYSAIYLSRLFPSFQKLPAAIFWIPSNPLVFIRNIALTRDRSSCFSCLPDIYSFAEIIWQMQCYTSLIVRYIGNRTILFANLTAKSKLKRFTNIFKSLSSSRRSFLIQLFYNSTSIHEQ